MVKKLFKYEMKHYLGIVLLIEAIILLMAFFIRITLFFEDDNIFYDILFYSSWNLFRVAIVLSFVIAEILIVVRFYKNLYTAEGYLSFTLPVTEAQHLFVKLLSAIVVNLALGVGALVAFFVATAGELGIEFIKAGVFLIEEFFEEFSSKTSAILNCSFYVVEIIIFVVTQLCFIFLLFYSCMTIGQLAKKNRVLAAIGMYIALTFVMQTITTVVTIFFAFTSSFDVYSDILEFINENFELVIHIVLCSAIVISGGLSVGFFALNRHIMSRKLNLE